MENPDEKTAKNSECEYDVLVIGGGPAGMMAAGRAAELGAKVALIEKNATLGRKLLITGGGRCNVTNAEPDPRKFLAKFSGQDKFLFSPFSQFSVEETLAFFHERNMPTKTEAENRVFPASNTAHSVWSVLIEYLRVGKVNVISNSPVVGLETKDGKITGVKVRPSISAASSAAHRAEPSSQPRTITARSYILATGGKSRPETGSTGDGFEWLKKIGHKVADGDAALVPVKAKEEWIKTLQGVSLAGVKLTLLQDGEKQDSRVGKILFTHFGLSGPLVLNMSRAIGELLQYGEAILSLDLLPALDYGMLNKRLQDAFIEHNNKKFKNSLDGLITPAVASVVVALSGINPDKKCAEITREERLSLVQLLKGVQMTVTDLLGMDKAVVTSGGVSLEEVDFKTMQSRLFPNLYLIGDILNIDRPSGGYSLQLCWTTGRIAGDHSAQK